MYLNVHNSIIHNHQQAEKPKCSSTNEWINSNTKEMKY